MRIKMTPNEIKTDTSTSWRLTANAKYWLHKLESFNTNERSWAEEIGEFNERQFDFDIDDQIFVQDFADTKKFRVLLEREWYRRLRETQPTGEVKIYHMGKDIDTLLLKIVLGQSYGLSIDELQKTYKIGESYISHGRNLSAVRQTTEQDRQQLMAEWTVHYES